MTSFHLPADELGNGRVTDRPAMTGAMIALAVLALHLLFGLVIALSPPLRGPTTARKPLVWLTELPRPVTGTSTGVIAFLSVAVPPPPPPYPSMPVLPASPDDDGVIFDAAQADAAQVARICGAWSMHRGHADETEQQPNVLVRVDADGRVSDSRLLVSSGSADRDAALQHCLLTLARLTPIHLEGHAVAAWQRLHPLESEASRRP